jgi:hypothetical protein
MTRRHSRAKINSAPLAIGFGNILSKLLALGRVSFAFSFSNLRLLARRSGGDVNSFLPALMGSITRLDDDNAGRT